MNESMEPIEAEEESEKARQRSTIGFPYVDYNAAAEVARAIHGNVGHGQCSISSQLAAWMDQSAKSSGFRTQLAAARLFGLIESDDSESYRLTDLGRRVVDQAQTRGASAESFLRVPLFKALFEKYKGGVIPPSAALEREIVVLGVSEKQKARARQVFESSAQQTGFREQGANRLVLPAVVVTAASPPNPLETPKSDGDSRLNLDPLLLALLHKIPKSGTPWPSEKRLRWFRTFAMNVSQVYDGNEADGNDVEFQIDLKEAGKGHDNKGGS